MAGKLFEQRIEKCRNQLDQIGLSINGGLVVGPAEMGSNRGLVDDKSLGELEKRRRFLLFT